jgi:hypothetical protein
VKKVEKHKAAAVDILADAQQPEPKPEDVTAVVDLARELYKLHVEIVELDRQRAEKAKKFNELQMVTLPERMASSGLASFQLANGYIVSIKEFISASVPTETQVDDAEGVEKAVLLDRRKKALKWLRDNKAGDLVKNKLTAEFGKGADKFAKKFFNMIKKAGYPTKCEESVNYQTLNSFIKEQLAKGVDIPSEPFALFIGKKAEIKKEKEKK